MYKILRKKKCIKSNFKEIFLKLVTNDQSDKMFLLTSKFCPQGVVSPCPGPIYDMNNVYKIRFRIYVFSCFPCGFEGRMWDLIVSVPDHCLSFYFSNRCF